MILSTLLRGTFTLFLVISLGGYVRAQEPPGTRLRPVVGKRDRATVPTTAKRAAARGDQPGKNVHTYSLAELETLALANNPTLVEARARIDGQRATALQAGLYPNPTVGYLSDQVGERNKFTKNSPGEVQGGFIQQEFVTAGKLRLSRDKYLARTAAAEFAAKAQELRVKNDVRMHYYRVLGAARRTGIQNELLKTHEDNLVTQRERFNVGQANEAEVDQANVVLQAQSLMVKEAENDAQQAWQELLSVIGTDLPDNGLEGSLEGPIPKLSFQSSLDRVLAGSPELDLSRALLRAEEITLQREKVQPVPNIFVQGSAGENFVAREPTYAAQVFVKLPIFDWNQGTIREARTGVAQQQAQVRLVELDLRRRLADAWRRFVTARQYVEDYRDVILPQAESRYRTTLISYKQDRETWVNVLDAQSDYFMRRMMHTQRLVELREAQTAIEGMLLMDGLMPPMNVTPPGHLDSSPKPR